MKTGALSYDWVLGSTIAHFPYQLAALSVLCFVNIFFSKIQFSLIKQIEMFSNLSVNKYDCRSKMCSRLMALQFKETGSTKPLKVTNTSSI